MVNEIDSGERAGPPEGDGPKVVEASWAPQDPRDRLYDETATKAERTMSLVRIIAAFHPVLNFFLLLSDVIRKTSLVGRLVLGGCAVAVGFWLFYSP